LGTGGAGKEAPGGFASPQTERAGGAAHVISRAGIADDDDIARHFRRAGGGVAALAVHDGVGLPDDLAALLVERIHPAIERDDIDLAPRDRDAAIDHVAAGRAIDLHLERRLEAPQLLAARPVIGIDTARHAGGVQDAIDDDRRRFEATARAQFRLPGQAQRADIVAVDVRQGRIMRLADVAARRHPIVRREARLGFVAAARATA